MAATDAVRSTAIARREVRNSLARLEYHLGRGTRGARGVQREIRFLDALHRQTVRVGAASVGVNATGRVIDPFGQRAARALATGNSATVGRMRSSLLADFSADGLQIVRDQATFFPRGAWWWTANASACPTCLELHGSSHNGAFTPAHPSCLCVPQPVGTEGLRALSNDEIIDSWEQYGDPRYRSQIESLRRGEITRYDLRDVEGVNFRPEGRRAVAEHLAKKEVRQTALGPGGEPAPAGSGQAGRLADPDVHGDTFDFHGGGTSEWTAERKALHDQIIDDYLKTIDPSDSPTAYMTGGGPASGKSTMLEGGQVHFPSRKVSAHIDPDSLKQYLPEYQRMVAAGDSRAAAFAHRESSYLSDLALRRAAERRLNLVYDGTGDSGIERLAARVAEMRRGGGRVVAEYATNDLKLALRLADERAARTGRMVPHEIIKAKHADVTDSFIDGVRRELWDEVRLWDTNIYQQPRLIGELRDGYFVIEDRALWESFVRKGSRLLDDVDELLGSRLRYADDIIEETAERAAARLADAADDYLARTSGKPVTQAIERTFREALEKIDDMIADAPEAVRARVRAAADHVRTWRIERLPNTAPRSDRYTLGHYGEVAKAGKRHVEQELMLQFDRRQTREASQWYARFNEAKRAEADRLFEVGSDQSYARLLQWEDEYRKANPMPRWTRPATSDEVADTLIHELTHVWDVNAHAPEVPLTMRQRYPSPIRKNAGKIFDEVESIFKRDGVVDEYAEEFWYAASRAPYVRSPMTGETAAELSRMYFNGFPAPTGGLQPLTGAEWRARYPQFARWVEENIFGSEINV